MEAKRLLNDGVMRGCFFFLSVQLFFLASCWLHFFVPDLALFEKT